jgi:hypothetical protein
MTLTLTGLDGTNPLGFFAALGVLEALHRAGREPALSWTDGVVPRPVIAGAGDDLVAVLDADRKVWQDSIVLHGPRTHPLTDAKPSREVMRAWTGEVVESLERAPDEADLFAALVAEGAVDGNENTKPTHLHFTAGQQQFLRMWRELAQHVDADRLGEALFGPWREDSTLPSLSWNAGAERLYAVRAINPAKEKRLGVPGADWLALLGLTMFPTCTVRTRDGFGLRTSGCDPAWKSSALRWPLWTAPVGRDTARSLVGSRDLVTRPGDRSPAARTALRATLRAWSVFRVLQAPIRRTDQGGYGSFGSATVIAEAAR